MAEHCSATMGTFPHHPRSGCALTSQNIDRYWSLPLQELLARLGSRPSGLTTAEATKQLRVYGLNRLNPEQGFRTLRLLAKQFQSPLILILLGAAILSFFLSEPADALIVIGIILLSSALGFWQEKRAADAVNDLIAIVQIKVAVLRDGIEREVSAENIVPGDVCVLNAGDIIPGDSILLNSKDLFADEAVLTGESYPAENR